VVVFNLGRNKSGFGCPKAIIRRVAEAGRAMLMVGEADAGQDFRGLLMRGYWFVLRSSGPRPRHPRLDSDPGEAE
jgi:hypothetical protein